MAGNKELLKRKIQKFKELEKPKERKLTLVDVAETDEFEIQKKAEDGKIAKKVRFPKKRIDQFQMMPDEFENAQSAIEAYQNPMMQVFAGIFVSGGFLFTFGQFVPSWDSAYYQLMMSQNIQYRDYISSKWWLMVIGTSIATIIASFYWVFFGWQIYMLIVVGAVYNIGVNSHLVMLGGAFVKTPIDLTMAKKAFGDKQAFNLKTMLISIPKLLVPMLLYSLGVYLHSAMLDFC